MELNVAYSSDENYARHLIVSILSLLDHNCECFERINIFVLSNEIHEKTRCYIESLSVGRNVSVTFFDFKEIEKKFKTDGQFPVSSFGRLFLSELIQKDFVLYLDCDSVVNSNYRELMSIQMDGYLCGAVQDNVSSYYKKSIGMKRKDVYFNAGVILMNLKAWREERILEKALEMITEYKGSVPHHDQGVLNAVCYKRIKRIHPKYNLQCPMFEYSPHQLQQLIPKYYSEQEIREAIEKPVFIHYTEGYSNRPWRIPCTHPYKDLYIKYMNRTEYSNQFEKKDINHNAKFMLNIYQKTPFIFYRLLLFFIEKTRRFRKIIGKKGV